MAVRTTPELLAQVREFAAAEQVSVSELMRELARLALSDPVPVREMLALIREEIGGPQTDTEPQLATDAELQATAGQLIDFTA